MLRQLEREEKIFDLPLRKLWRGSPDLDTSVSFHGRRAANPLGPAAGPHVQMAQNIVLAWLAGSRILELKTVQVKDRLVVPRPCIDAANVCFNIEWSQELRLLESLREYVTASMLIDILKHENPLGHASDPAKGETLLDMSVGYDLAGVRSPQVRSWIGAMKDATPEIDKLRQRIPEDFRRLRDLDFTTALSRQVTLSTFHGCPAGEVEAMARVLLTELDVDVTVKLNPTLLGRKRVDELLHDLLGYTELQTRPRDFETDLQWQPALEMTDRLAELARSGGRSFGIKLSNTLVVKNHRQVFPATEAVHYLSGQPLHVITLSLVERFRRARPGIPISFSAGVDKRNFPDCVALGLIPVTTCTDLLRPGGYGRLPQYLDNLEERMRDLGVTTVGDFVVKALERAGEAIETVVEEPSLRSALRQSLAREKVDLRGTLERAGREDLYDELVSRAAQLNTPAVLDKALRDPRYRAESNRRVPRKVGSQLWLFDCLNCDKCIPVCPNDANFAYEIFPHRAEYANYRVEDGAPVAVPGGSFEVRESHQLASFQDFCNDCGNCDTFCPEDGGPFLQKPRFFGSLEAWRRWAERDGLFVIRRDDVDAVWGRVAGVTYHLEIDRFRDRGLFTDGVITVEVRHGQRLALGATARPGAAEGHTLDFAAYLHMALAVDGVLDPRRANPVNAAFP
jgi:putative selenate reductase